MLYPANVLNIHVYEILQCIRITQIAKYGSGGVIIVSYNQSAVMSCYIFDYVYLLSKADVTNSWIFYCTPPRGLHSDKHCLTPPLVNRIEQKYMES